MQHAKEKVRQGSFSCTQQELLPAGAFPPSLLTHGPPLTFFWSLNEPDQEQIQLKTEATKE